MKYNVIEVKERVIADNDRVAAAQRARLQEKGIYFINLMGSPGAGKTSVLIRTIEALRNRFRIAVMEADVDSAVDAETISRLGVPVIQLHTAGLCHMDADMTARGIEALMEQEQGAPFDILILENIGNLVCPAEFDVGAAKRVMILSVPEGDDKPLKYPLMFEVSDVVLVNKIDTKEIFDFDEERFRENVRMRNPQAEIFPLSARTGEGMEAWFAWLAQEAERGVRK